MRHGKQTYAAIFRKWPSANASAGWNHAWLMLNRIISGVVMISSIRKWCGGGREGRGACFALELQFYVGNGFLSSDILIQVDLETAYRWDCIIPTCPRVDRTGKIEINRTESWRSSLYEENWGRKVINEVEWAATSETKQTDSWRSSLYEEN